MLAAKGEEKGEERRTMGVPGNEEEEEEEEEVEMVVDEEDKSDERGSFGEVVAALAESVSGNAVVPSLTDFMREEEDIGYAFDLTFASSSSPSFSFFPPLAFIIFFFFLLLLSSSSLISCCSCSHLCHSVDALCNSSLFFSSKRGVEKLGFLLNPIVAK